jgi:hypothetical protein
MGAKTAGFAVIAIAVAALLIVPGGLAAKEKRGASVIVTRVDGQLFEGELIAVRQDSLVLLGPSGADVSVSAAEIGSVRIVRPSKVGKGAMLGGLGGALIGGILGGTSGGIDEYTASQTAFMLGFVLGAIGGLGVGTLMSVDTIVPFAGEPDAIVRTRLEKLRPYCREYRMGGGKLELKIGPPAAPTTRPPVRAPEAAGSAPSPPRRVPRFRVQVPYTVPIRPPFRYGDVDTVPTTFRFLDDLPDPGPHPAELSRHVAKRNRSGFDSVSLGYEASDHLALETELVFWHWAAESNIGGALRYDSTIDGTTYENDYVYYSIQARFSAALFGLAYRPFAPTEFRRHIVETGLAAGPAWVKFAGDEPLWQGDLPSGKVTLAARAHAAYDFYVTPNLSFGVAAGYRYFRASLPASTETATLLWDASGEKNAIERITEVMAPPHTIGAGGFYISLRTGFRF